MPESAHSELPGIGAEKAPDTGAEPVSPAPEPPSAQLRPPNALRLLAWLIDCTIIAAIVVAQQGSAGWRRLDYWILPLLYLTVYHGLFVALFGQTPGKAVLALRVVRLGRRRRGVFWSLGRAGLGYPFIDLLTLAAVTVLFDGQRRAPHDFIFGSQVVYEPERQDIAAPLRRVQRLSKDTVDTVEGWKGPWILLGAFVDLLVQLANWIDSAARAIRGLLGGSPHAAQVAPAPALHAGASAAVTIVATGAVLAGLTAVPTPVVDPCNLVSGDRITTAIRETNPSVTERITLRRAKQEPSGTRQCIVPSAKASSDTEGQELSSYALTAMTSRHPIWLDVQKSDSPPLAELGDEAYLCSRATAGPCLESEFIGGGGAYVYARSGNHVVEVGLAGDERKATKRAQELAREALERWATLGSTAPSEH